MKILEVIPNLQGGGAENFLVSLSNEISKRKNIEVTILTLYPTDDKDDILIKRISPSIKLQSLNKKQGLDLRCFFNVLKFIRTQKFDLAHFHINAILYSFVASLLYRRCKYFATIHSDAYKEAQGIHRLARKIMFKLGLAYPITISNDSNRSFREVYKCSGNIIYNGVATYNKKEDIDLRKYKRTQNTKVFVNIASIQRLKNQVAMANVFNCLVSEGEDVVLLLVGRITDANKEYANELKTVLSENVHFLGENSNPRDYMIKSDYFILASHYEGLPITLLESLSVGCIPVVTAVGGNIDVVKDGYNGYLIENPSEEAIYSTIKRIIKTGNGTAEKIREHIRESATKYTIEECANRHLALFKSKLN